MPSLPRRLSFAVGTSLLGASLSIGCTAKPATEEKKDATSKQAPAPEVPNGNTEPPPQPPPQPLLPEPPPEPIHVNEGPIVVPPPPPPPEIKVNPGPEPAEQAPEPPQVNTRPTDR